MVPLIKQINDPLELNQTEIGVEDKTYNKEDLDHFQAATGIDLENYIPQSQLAHLSEDTMANVLEATGIGTGLDIEATIQMAGR